MAQITTYATLQDNVEDFIDRTDLATQVPVFIQLAESKLKRDTRVREISNQGTWTISAEGDPLPADFGRVDEFYHDGPTYYGPIEIVSDLGLIKARFGLSTAGVPRFAATKDERIYYAPEPDDTYTVQMTYFRKLTPLSDSNTSNWLLEEHPDVYLYAAIVEAALYLKDGEMLQQYATLLENKLDEIHLEQQDSQWGGGSLKRHYPSMGG